MTRGRTILQEIFVQIEDDGFWHQSMQRLPSPEDNDVLSINESYTGGKSVLREVGETIVLTLLIFFAVRAVVQNFKVEGDSMLPSLHSEQYLLVNKALYFRYDANLLTRITQKSAPVDMRYLFHGPQRGDIIVFEAPTEPKDFIKRVIAVEGETVEIKPDANPEGTLNQDCGGCGVYVNGVKLDEQYVRQTPDYALQRTTIPPGYIFVLGDNRRNSSDSHVWGALDVSRIIGTAFISYWGPVHPEQYINFLPHPTYAEIKKSNP
jgi:signal peptidase I